MSDEFLARVRQADQRLTGTSGDAELELEELRELAYENLESICAHLLPGGRHIRHDFKCGDLAGSPGDSFSVCLKPPKRGVWSDFATGESGGDVIALWQAVRNCSFGQAIAELKAWLLDSGIELEAGEKAPHRQRDQSTDEPFEREYSVSELPPLDDEMRDIVQAWRGLSDDCCSWLQRHGYLGLYHGYLALPAHDCAGNIVKVHYLSNTKEYLQSYFSTPRCAEKQAWRQYPTGLPGKLPLVIHKVARPDLLVVGESPWDCFSFLDQERLHQREFAWTIVCTFSASNTWLFESFIAAKPKIVYVLGQRDKSNEKWRQGIVSSLGLTARVLLPPEATKDLNDWIRDGHPTEEQWREMVNGADELHPQLPTTVTNVEGFVHDESKDEFYFDYGAHWGYVNERRVRQYLQQKHGLTKENLGDMYLAAMDKAIVDICEQCGVRDVVNVGGYTAGIKTDSFGKRFLVTQSPFYIQPRPGPWAELQQLFEGMFSAEQLVYWYGWLWWADQTLLSQSRAPGQCLVLYGPPSSGKTLLQEKVISPLLGSLGGKALRCLTGNEFDADLYRHFHWYVSDGLHLSGYHEREALGERLKNYADCKTHSVHGKHANAFEIEFACRISISVNRSSISSLPPLLEGVKDKLMLLLVNQPPADQTYLPHARRGQDEYEALIRAQLPMCLWKLRHEYKVPPELADPRFGIKTFHHPDVIALMEESDIHQDLVDVLATYLPQDGEYRVTELFGKLHDKNCESSKVMPSIVKTKNTFAKLLTDLEKDGDPSGRIVVRRRKSNGERLVRITITHKRVGEGWTLIEPDNTWETAYRKQWRRN